MTEKKQNQILKIILLFVLLQPFLDILSRLAIMDVIPNISTFIKPLFVFGIMTYLLILYSPIKKKWLTYIVTFIIFTLAHLYILYRLLVEKSIIIHEFRFMLNIAYMIGVYISLYTLYYHANDKEKMFRMIKNTIKYTFFIYFILYLVAILTGTSGMTYEYSDKYKLGYKGWYDSGQILGHAFSITFPILMYTILKPNNSKIIRILFIALSLFVVSLLGTKVPYFITIIVLVLYLIMAMGLKVLYKDFEKNWFNIFLVIISLICLISTYKYTPVKYNTDINTKNAQIELSLYDLNSISGKKKLKDIIKEHQGEDLNYLEKYYKWSEASSDYLQEMFYKGKVHPSDTRKKQMYYSYKKFMLADIEYKLLGIGYLNQDEMLSIERDFFMALFDFGIIGFILFLIIPIVEFIKSTTYILKNIKKIDLETYMVYMGIGIFFCISIYAGYTYIYTNFSIFLCLLLIMIKLKLDIIRINNKKKVKTIDFLLLHLGYGGIETATINSANALSKNYDINIISFYKLDNNQAKKLNSKIKIKYLYKSGPNREEFLDYKQNKQYIKMLIEGFKSLWILFLKKYKIIYTIITTKSDAIVSTRVEFNRLLSIYGKNDTLKIAQEHHHHNNNKKYIKKLKNDYYNIDYLCALTSTLKKDYEDFLKNNTHTKVVLLPNMLTKIPKNQSNLKTNNLITVSRLDPGKRNNEIIEIFSKIKDSNKLFIIGDGQEYNNLKNQIKDLKLENRVELLGYKNQEEIGKYMLKSSCFLMASISEGLPMVLLEAMSYGLPCIAYQTDSGINDIIDNNKNGYVINNRNEKEYVKKIEELINNPEKKKEFSKNATNTVKKFQKEEILKIWYKILNIEV